MLLEPQFTARAADELFSRDRFEIKPFTMMCSPMAEGLSETARGEFHSSYGPSLLFLESIWRNVGPHIAESRGHRTCALDPGRLFRRAGCAGSANAQPVRRRHRTRNRSWDPCCSSIIAALEEEVFSSLFAASDQRARMGAFLASRTANNRKLSNERDDRF
jgi:hypothetical protein